MNKDKVVENYDDKMSKVVEKKAITKDKKDNMLIPIRRGLGQYGCYYYPRVPCHEFSLQKMREIDNNEILGSKVQIWSKLLDNELMHVEKLISIIPDHPLYFVLPKKVCTLSEAELDSVSDCYVLHKDKNKRRTPY